MPCRSVSVPVQQKVCRCQSLKGEALMPCRSVSVPVQQKVCRCQSLKGEALMPRRSVSVPVKQNLCRYQSVKLRAEANGYGGNPLAYPRTQSGRLLQLPPNVQSSQRRSGMVGKKRWSGDSQNLRAYQRRNGRRLLEGR